MNPATLRDRLLLNSVLHPRGHQIALSPTRLVEIYLSQGTSKSSVGQPQVKTIEGKTEVKYFPKVEWSLAYSEENEVLLLIMAKSEGKGKLEQGKMFTYGSMWNVDYEDRESNNLILDVQSAASKRRVVVDETNLVVDYCTPKVLRKDIQTKNSLIVALRPYLSGELMVA